MNSHYFDLVGEGSDPYGVDPPLKADKHITNKRVLTSTITTLELFKDPKIREDFKKYMQETVKYPPEEAEAKVEELTKLLDDDWKVPVKSTYAFNAPTRKKIKEALREEGGLVGLVGAFSRDKLQTKNEEAVKNKKARQQAEKNKITVEHEQLLTPPAKRQKRSSRKEQPP